MGPLTLHSWVWAEVTYIFIWGDGLGGFSSPELCFSIYADFGRGGTGMVAFDLEGDGDLDIAAEADRGGEVFIYENDGTGQLTSPDSYVFDFNSQAGFDAYDIDEDGDHDLVIATWQIHSLYIVKNLGGILGSPQLIDSTIGKSASVGAPPLTSSPIQVQIDIKPDSSSNYINANGHGLIPVAILGSELFEVSDVDMASLNFEGLSVSIKGNNNAQCPCEDINTDGFIDLVCHFVDDLDKWIPDSGSDDTATLEGTLLDGTSFMGTDDICFVP